VEQLVLLADVTGASQRKAEAAFQRGCVLALTGKATEAVPAIDSAITAIRSTGATCFMPLRMSLLANAHARLGQVDDAWRCISEAIAASEASKETWCDADLHRVAGEIVLLSGDPDTANAETYFERALAVARKQRARSFELRAAKSLARLWKSQGKRVEAYELLAPIYNWFTEGFDSADLKEAKALLRDLSTS
jgi:predicted ATPase